MYYEVGDASQNQELEVNEKDRGDLDSMCERDRNLTLTIQLKQDEGKQQEESSTKG